MDRRDFIKKTGKAAALAAATTGCGFFFYDRGVDHPPTIHFDRKTGYGVAPQKDLPLLTQAKNADPAAALRAALDAIGGIGRFVSAGEKVVVKPNVAWDRTMEQAANTHPELVAEMVRLCLAAGAKEVVVTDVTCNDARRTFVRSGIREAAEKAGARVHLPEESDFVEVALNGDFMDVWPVVNEILSADRLINMPIAKHHGLSGFTGGMKNLYGIVGGRRNQLHQKIDESIVDLARFSPPTLTVIDGDFREITGFEAGSTLLGLSPRPTAVFTANDSMAIGLLAALQRAGCRVPDDIAVVGFDDVAIAGYLNPALTTVHVDACGLGRQAVDMMLGALDAGAQLAPVRQVIPAVLKIRQSCGARVFRMGEMAVGGDPIADMDR